MQLLYILNIFAKLKYKQNNVNAKLLKFLYRHITSVEIIYEQVYFINLGHPCIAFKELSQIKFFYSI